MRARRRGLAGVPNFRAGIVALILAALIVFFGFTKGIPGLHHYTVNAVFPSAHSLLTGSSVHPGSPVRIAGVEVGQVTSIKRGPGNTALVGMRIDQRGRPVHTDATARIRPRLFLEGNFFVDLKPGTPARPDIGDGGTISVTQTAEPVGLNQVLNSFEASSREDLRVLVKEYATALSGGGAQAFNRSYQYWPGAFANVAIASRAGLGRGPHDLSRFVAASGKTAAAIASRDQQLSDLVVAFDRTVTALAVEREPLARGIDQLDALLRESPPELHAVDSATGPLARFSRALRAPLVKAAPVLDAAVPLLHRVGQLVAPRALPALLADLRPTIRALVSLEPKLNDLLSLVAPVTACLRDHALPVLNGKLDDGSLSSNQPVWEELLHGSAGLASATQNFDGNGYNTRFSFGTGQDVVSLGGTAGSQQSLLAFGAISGSRPKPPAQPPPFHPEVPCETQQVPNLAAPSQAPVGQRVVAHVDAPIVQALARAVTEGTKGSGK